MPVLYNKQNKFRTSVKYSERPSWSRLSGIMPYCALSVYWPGGERYFYHSMYTGFTSLHSLFEDTATAHMLRMLTHLTIDLELVTPQGRKEESFEYGIKACKTIKTLCLALAGASNLEELSVIVKPGHKDSSDVDPVDILWPLLLLRSSIKVKFEGITTDPEKTSTDRSLELDTAFCQRIALVRQLCNDELNKPGWEERHWDFHGMRDAEKELYALELPGKRLCLHDLVSMSPVWRGIRGEIDRAEASGLGQ